MESLWTDLAHSLRQLTGNAVFASVALLTLAVGIGANSVIFSVVHAVLLRPLPYEDPDEIVVIWETVQEYSQVVPSPANFVVWERQAGSFEALAAVQSYSVSLAESSWIGRSVYQLLNLGRPHNTGLHWIVGQGHDF